VSLIRGNRVSKLKKKLESREQYLQGLDGMCGAIRWPKPWFLGSG